MIISREQIQTNKEKIIQLLLDTKRPNIEKLVERLEQSDFFYAPASTKYHLCCSGGLAHHSLMVCGTLKKLCETFNIDIPLDTIVITGLLHDMCKMNYYIMVRNSFHKHKDASEKHGLLSVERIKFFIDLSETEELMIRWHMGPYTKDGNYREADDVMKRHPESFLMYFADHISTLFRED